MKVLFQWIGKTRWLQHLVFWIFSFYVIGSYFSISNELKLIDFIYSGFFHFPLILMVVVNVRLLIPRVLLKEKYLLYGLFAGISIVGAYLLHQLIFDFLIPVLPTDLYIVSFADSKVLFSIFGGYLVVSTLLKLSKSWYQLQQLEKENLFLELNTLKMQINPHFLFNCLNSIYSLARKKNEQTPGVILMLSDLMRYMIYEVADDKVSIENEVEAIKNYLDLQKLRVEKITDIQFNVDVDDFNQQLAPLLFFPLIENSFKHGLGEEAKSNYVHITLSCAEQRLTFMVRNNKKKVDDIERGKYGGIGLENVKKRLQLIYGEKAALQISNEKSTFEVGIKIDLS
ncbi:MAG: histidine kinase [Bacteroidota bacterium]